MRFDPPLRTGVLERRYKRFLADVRLDDGEEFTAHVANTGAMLGCCEPLSRIALSHHQDSGRKLPWSWQLIEVGDAWVCVNTLLANRIVEEAVRSGRIGPLRGYPELRREVAYGDRSRIDLHLDGRDRPCFVEVKNVTLREGRRAVFPDTVSERGTRHLNELIKVADRGDRAVMLFLVNRGDCGSFAPADAHDPVYARTLREAASQGVEVLAYRTRPTLEGIDVEKKLPVHL
ncbi:MAG: DNA/RNA nuclease SfsA [Planctomycetes bacterium]|nr:DNA/RNA nuclease SfsA [Planctomycetota bacterium]